MKGKQGQTRGKTWLIFAGIIILAVFCALVIFPNLPSYIPGASFFNKFTPKLGLDLQGGVHLVYQADTSGVAGDEIDEAMAGVRDVIERRVNAFGVSEPVVQTSGSNRLIVELAGVFDVEEAIRQIGETPSLEFKELNPAATETPELTAAQQAEMDAYNTQAKKTAQNLIARLNQGEDFATLAQQYSEDSATSSQGGDLGYNKKGVFVSEFEQAIWEDLAVGEITSEPVETVYGYHIIRKDDQRGEGDDTEIKASHILIKTKSEYDYLPAVDQWLNTELTGKNLQSAAVVFSSQTNTPTVSLEFDDEGKKLFAEITKRNVGQPVAIFLDGEAISIPTVQEEITEGKAIISGSFSIAEAKLLVQRLNAGALPIPIELISQQTIGPSLGQESLVKSLFAGLLGLIMVAIFMIAFYRLPGLLSVVALFIYTLITLAIFELWPITLSLAGIAGYLLSIGMAVDANVLIFERMREEIRLGKPLGTAIEEGFKRAWLSIRDSNASSLITCLILFWFGSSIIQGFAITLGIGILVSMFSAITITRTLLRLIVKRSLNDRLWLFNVKIEEKKNV